MPLRNAFALLVLGTMVFLGLSGQARPAQAQEDRFFAATGFSVADDEFWNYFQRRGGVDTFGQPISRKFVLMGAEVQFFQRLVMQKRPDGSVTTLNLLDPGLMPVTHINGSTFPGPDPALTSTTPTPADSDYGSRIIEFVDEHALDTWNDLPVDFLATFNSVVLLEDAYPDGGGDPSLLPLLNLEVWGAPTSEPAEDPANHDFVYQRFQRVIAHFDRSCGCTRPLLLADWFKSVLTGRGLPPDLADEMRDTPFFLQYDLSQSNGVARPNDLPGTNMLFAFEREDQPIANAPTPGPGSTPGPSGPTMQPSASDVNVLSSDLAQDPTSKRWVGYGEIQNASSNTLRVAIRLNVFDVRDRPMAVKQEEAGVSPLGPGQLSTFRLDFGRLPDGVDHFTTEIVPSLADTPGVNGLKVSERRTAFDRVHFVVTGMLENRSGDDVKDLRMGVSFLNKDGDLLDVWQGSPVFDSIPDNGVIAFQATSELADPSDVADYTVYVFGSRGALSPPRESDIAEVKNTRLVTEAGLLRVLGDLQSDVSDDAADVTIAVLLYDADDNLVGAGSGTALPVRLLPKSTIPFKLEFIAPPDGYDHVKYVVRGQLYHDEGVWPQALRIKSSKLEKLSAGARVTGSTTNNHKTPVHDAFVVVGFYNASDKLVDVVSADLDDPNLKQDDDSDFEASSSADGIETAKVQAYGYRE